MSQPQSSWMGRYYIMGTIWLFWGSWDANFVHWWQLRKCLCFEDCNCSHCPHNWTQNGKSCYYVFQIQKKWNGSKDICLNEDARLLQIDSKEEMVKTLLWFHVILKIPCYSLKWITGSHKIGFLIFPKQWYDTCM